MPSPTLSLSPTEVPSRYEITVDTENANIRTGPGTVYKIIAVRPRGTVLEATGRSQAGDWLVIRLEDGRTGWISASIILSNFDHSLLQVVQAPPTPPPPTKAPTEASGGSTGPGTQPTWTPPPP